MRPLKMRNGAGIIALMALGAVTVRIYLNMDAENVGPLGAIWNLSRFFTMWTNALIGVLCAAIAFGLRPAQWMAGCLAGSIVVVAGVYHALLAQFNSYEGIDRVIDLMLHTFVPIAFVSLWLFVLPKAALRIKDLIYFMAYPLVYCIFALGRGAFDGVYPYGFLNVTDLGVSGVAVNVAGLVLVFGALGGAVIAIARLSARR